MPPAKPPRLKDNYWITLGLSTSELGIKLSSNSRHGVRICDITQNSAAAIDGRLQIGDVILQINDVSVVAETADFAR